MQLITCAIKFQELPNAQYVLQHNPNLIFIITNHWSFLNNLGCRNSAVARIFIP